MKKLDCKYFQYSDQLKEFVNKYKVEPVAITGVSKYTNDGEGFILFYWGPIVPEELYRIIPCKVKKPSMSGWYSTSKGKLYWWLQDNEWSCTDDHISSEYPEWWLEKA
jgi:hypothetical protein